MLTCSLLSVRSYLVNRDVEYRLILQFFSSLVGLSAKYPLPEGSSLCSLLAPSPMWTHPPPLIFLFVAMAATEKSDLLTMMQSLIFTGMLCMHNHILTRTWTCTQRHSIFLPLSFITHVYTHAHTHTCTLAVSKQAAHRCHREGILLYCVIYCVRKWSAACFLSKLLTALRWSMPLCTSNRALQYPFTLSHPQSDNSNKKKILYAMDTQQLDQC